MTLYAYRSQRVEELVDALAQALSASWPDDPFEPSPIVVGSRGMERWLRHELATRLDGLARVEFLFPRAAFDGAARWLSTRPSADDRAPFWEHASADEAWSDAPLTMRLLARLRARLGEPPFARIRDYLGDVGGEVRARELTLATDVASTVEKLLHDRPEDAIAWSAAPASAPKEHAWLATLLADLVADLDEPSPAHRLAAIRALPAANLARPLFVFGLSTLRPGDKARLAALARHLDVHLFALAPSSEWWEDIRRVSEQRAALREEHDPEAIAALLADIARKNAVLSANGGPSRDFQLWLEAVGYEEPFERRALEPAPTLLGRLHAFIDEAADNPRGDEAPWSANAGCRSLEIHACHGALRQCEALRDELLRRFADDPTLEPRHVLVMTPDLETYAPLVAAVLSRGGRGDHGDAPAIPLHIADLGLRARNPVADALLRALALADERVTASRLLDLLALPPVRARFGLAEDDLRDLTTMIVESGIRWAWDARDRARHAQPALDQNTVRFGLERLALGVSMHDPAGLGTVATSADGALPPAVPLDVAPRERVERFGRLADACAKLERLGDDLATPAPGRVWRERLRGMLDELTRVSDDEAWLRVEIEERLEDRLPDDVAEDLSFDRSAIASLLGSAFDPPQRGDRPITGAVTVSALEPMRSVPFRVIAILGLDDGAFPRPASVAAWDPFARARHGEWDRRAIDRHLLLEAVLCARDALLLFGNGFEPKRGAAVPLSVAVSELSELVAAGVGVPSERLAIRHPLKPWSEQGFADERRLPFDGLWSEAALARAANDDVASGLAATRLDATWPEEEDPPRTLDAVALAKALGRPQQELLGRRLGIPLAPDDVEVRDREPLEQGSLDAWRVRDQVLAAMSDGGDTPDVAALEARLRGEGVLPLAAGGRKELDACIAEAAAARRRAHDITGGRAGSLTASCEVDGLTLTTAVADVRVDGDERRFVWVTPSAAPNDRLELTGWIALLVASAAGVPVRAAHLVGHERSVELRAPAGVDEARDRLAVLVDTWRTIRRSPVLLFPRLSRDVAERARRAPDASDAELVLAASGAWNGSSYARGDLDDPWVSALFGRRTIDDLAADAASIVALASAVWGPLLDAMVSKKKGGA